MTQAILLGGLGFGDEGKGATVDYLTRHFGADMVIRYNGGHQAGHRVQLPGGTSHVFSQFGSGYFAGATTHHTRHSIIEPGAMVREANHLRSMFEGEPFKHITVDPRCLVTPRYLKLMNRIQEESRNFPHGSCGVGIGETKNYYLQFGEDSILAKDLSDEGVLAEKLELMRARCIARLQWLPVRRSRNLDNMMRLRPYEEAAWLSHESRQIKTEKYPHFEVGIFEGAQGILLDEQHGFHPNTTWSDITYRWAHEFLLHYPHAEKLRVGVTRCYHTRHGNGPLPSDNERILNQSPPIQISEDGNQENDWQGSIRYGWLDLVLLKYGIQCLKPDYLVVNHMDQFPSIGRAITHYDGEWSPRAEYRNLRDSESLNKSLSETAVRTKVVDADGLLEEITKLGKIAIIGEGPTWQDRHTTRELEFRD